jgi:hypothetical protein
VRIVYADAYPDAVASELLAAAGVVLEPFLPDQVRAHT